jgi:hypothetical protein
MSYCGCNRIIIYRAKNSTVPSPFCTFLPCFGILKPTKPTQYWGEDARVPRSNVMRSVRYNANLNCVFATTALGARSCNILFSDALVERSRQRRGRPKRREATPTARLSPMPPLTETGCNAAVRLEPPIRTLAPRPAPTLASPLAPT